MALPPVPTTGRPEGISRQQPTKSRQELGQGHPTTTRHSTMECQLYSQKNKLFENLTEKHKADVITIQESRLYPRNKTPGFSNYHPVRKYRPVQEEA